MFFKFVMLYKNFDSVVDMVDGEWFVRFIKYELLIYNKINKIIYSIGLIYFIVLIFGLFFVI